MQPSAAYTTPTRRAVPTHTDCEAGDIEEDVGKFQLPSFRIPVKSSGGMLRTSSFSGTFSSSTAEQQQQQQRSLSRHASACGPVVLTTLCAIALLATAAGAWMAASRAEESMRAIQTDVHAIRATLHDLSSALHEHSMHHSGTLGTIRTEQARLAEGLPATLRAHLDGSLLARLEAIEQSLAAKPSTEHFSTPFAQVMQGLTRLERAAGAQRMELLAQSSELHAVAHEVHDVAHPTEPRPPTNTQESVGAASQSPAAQPASQHAAGHGQVAVTFVYEPSLPSVGGAVLYWLGEIQLDGTQEEKRYTEIPRGMRVVETTRPGECWRARHAKSAQILLDKHCATAQPQQEVVIR